MTTNKAPRTRKLADAEKAFAYWEKNTYLSKTEVCDKFVIQLDDLGYWMKINKKARPDGRVIGKESPRQILLREKVTQALAEGKTLEWVWENIRKEGHSLGKGDIRYYTMKNNLPDLVEEKTTFTKGGKYG